MPSGYGTDRGVRGVTYNDRVIKTRGAAWLEPTGGIVLFDDFLGDTLNTNTWVATETATGVAWAVSSTAGDPVAAHGGWVSAQTDNVDAAAEELACMAATTVGNFRPDRAGNGLLVFEARVSIPTALTARFFNVGLTDDETEGAALAMSITTATWTTTATDAALWVFDSTATDNDNWLGQTVDSGSDGTHIASTVATAADTAQVLRIEIDSAGGCYFYEGGAFMGVETAIGVTETVPLIPYVAAGSTATTAVDFECDYVYTACAR